MLPSFLQNVSAKTVNSAESLQNDQGSLRLRTSSQTPEDRCDHLICVLLSCSVVNSQDSLWFTRSFMGSSIP